MGIASIVIGTLSIILGAITWLIFNSVTGLDDDNLIAMTFIITESITFVSPIIPIIGLIFGIVGLILKHVKKKPRVTALAGIIINLLALFFVIYGILGFN